MTSLATDLDDARLALRETGALLDAAQLAHTRAQTALDRIVERAVEGSLHRHAGCDVVPTDHRSDHRPGVPSKFDTDPELRAFALARLDRLSFETIATDIAEAFPPHRRLAKSALHKWWQRNVKPDTDPKTHLR